MPAPENQFEAMARDAAQRVEESRDLRQQLSLLPDETEKRGTVARSRGAGKAMSQMRRWLADRGLRMPEEVLAEMAGLDQGGDTLTATMADAERLLAWAESGAVTVKGNPAVQTMTARMQAFMQLYTIRLRAAEALLPFGAPKAAADAPAVNVTQIVVAGEDHAARQAATARPAPADLARDVTPGARRIGPPLMPHQIEQNQQVRNHSADSFGHDRRTDSHEH